MAMIRGDESAEAEAAWILTAEVACSIRAYFDSLKKKG